MNKRLTSNEYYSPGVGKTIQASFDSRHGKRFIVGRKQIKEGA